MRLLIEHTVAHFNGAPPFDHQLPDPDDRTLRRLGVDVQLHWPADETVALIAQLDDDTASDVTSRLADPRTVGAVFDQDQRFDVKAAAAWTGLLDARRTLDAIAEDVVAHEDGRESEIVGETPLRELVEVALDVDGSLPVWLTELIAERGEGDLLTATLTDGGPLRPGLAREIVARVVAEEVPIDQATAAAIEGAGLLWPEQVKLVPCYTDDALDWLLTGPPGRRLQALYHPSLPPLRRSELIAAMPPSALSRDAAALTVSEAASAIRNLDPKVHARGFTDLLGRFDTSTSGGSRWPAELVEALLELPGGVSLVLEETDPDAWDDELVDVFTCKQPQRLGELLAWVPALTGPVRYEAFMQLDAERLADVLGVSGTVDDVRWLQTVDAQRLDEALIVWSNSSFRERAVELPDWAAVAVEQLSGCPERFGAPLARWFARTANGRFGRDRDSWQLLLTLSSSWAGPVSELLDTVESLARSR